MNLALIYDSLSLKKISTKLPPKLKNMDLITFKCAAENALKHKVNLSHLNLKKIDPAIINAASEYAFFQAIASASQVSLGHKSCLALSYCSSSGSLLVSSDQCVLNIAKVSELEFLKV